MSEFLEREEEVLISFSIEDKTCWRGGGISRLMLRIKFPLRPALMDFLLCTKEPI